MTFERIYDIKPPFLHILFFESLLDNISNTINIHNTLFIPNIQNNPQLSNIECIQSILGFLKIFDFMLSTNIVQYMNNFISEPEKIFAQYELHVFQNKYLQITETFHFLHKPYIIEYNFYVFCMCFKMLNEYVFNFYIYTAPYLTFV